MKNNTDDKSAWIIGGTTQIGLGIGFVCLRTSALLFIASGLVEIGSIEKKY